MYYNWKSHNSKKCQNINRRNVSSHHKNNHHQESIRVGCVPSARWSLGSPAKDNIPPDSTPRTAHTSAVLSRVGAVLSGRGGAVHNRKWHHNTPLPLWTDRCKNITLPQLRLRAVKIWSIARGLITREASKMYELLGLVVCYGSHELAKLCAVHVVTS